MKTGKKESEILSRPWSPAFSFFLCILFLPPTRNISVHVMAAVLPPALFIHYQAREQASGYKHFTGNLSAVRAQCLLYCATNWAGQRI